MQLFWEAFTLREHEWHQRDLGARLAVIRFDPGLPAQGETAPNWGPPASWVYPAEFLAADAWRALGLPR